MTKFKLHIKPLGASINTAWWEEYEKDLDGLTVEQYGQLIIDAFNAHLRPGEEARELVGFELLGEIPTRHTLTLHYSVQNGGDGSAYPQFSLDRRLAEIHQALENMYEGWGEPCTGSITLESDSPITVNKEEDLITKESLIEQIEEMLDGDYYEDNRDDLEDWLGELKSI